MNKETIEKKILKNRYIDFAYNRYIAFKETPQYDEYYKLEILEDLNNYFKTNNITETTVMA